MYMYKDKISLIWHGGMFSFYGLICQERTLVHVEESLQQDFAASKAKKNKNLEYEISRGVSA